MIAAKFLDLNVQKVPSQFLVYGVVGEIPSQGLHFRNRIRNSVFTEIGKQVVVVMNADKTGVHRPAPEVRLEERVHGVGFHRGNGSVTHRDSRNEISRSEE